MNVLMKSVARGGARVSIMRGLAALPRLNGGIFKEFRGLSSTLRLANKVNNIQAEEINPSNQSRYKPPVTVDRELPDPFVKQRQNRYYFVVYGIGVTVSCIITFNYEKTRSPITNSTLFFLRRAEISKTLLGNGIDYASSWPWISGPLNTVKGDIDISFAVKGDNKNGTVRLKATRKSRSQPFVIHHFLLDVDGQEYDLTKDKKMDFGLD